MRVNCEACKEKVSYPDELLKKVGLKPDASLAFSKGHGCDACNGTGYRGRTAAFEILVVDPAIHGLIRERADSRLIKQAAVTGGLHTLLDDALSKALFGQTTLEEVIRVAYE